MKLARKIRALAFLWTVVSKECMKELVDLESFEFTDHFAIMILGLDVSDSSSTLRNLLLEGAISSQMRDMCPEILVRTSKGACNQRAWRSCRSDAE